jgi:hypothetical protein
MTYLKKLTDDGLHKHWVAVLESILDTNTMPMFEGDEASMDEYSRRQDALEAVEAERNRRFRKRQRDSRGTLLWRDTYMFGFGPDGTKITLNGWEAYVGQQLVGHVKCPNKFTKLRWSWAVYQCNSGPIISGELPSLEQAKEAVEKRVSRWFELAGMPLAA